MEQNSRLKPATKHVIRCAAALACPKMAPTFLIGQTLNNVSALSTALLFSNRGHVLILYFDVKGRGHNFDKTTVLMPDTKGLDSLDLTSVLFTG